MLEVVCIAITVYTVILVIRIILSWVTMFWSPPPSMSQTIRVVYDLTEPVMSQFRKLIPPIGGMDLSPILIFLILGLIQDGLGCGPFG